MLVYRYEGDCPPGYERDPKGNLVRKWSKIQRGDICPCKSGKKFRKCCRSAKTLLETLREQQREAEHVAKLEGLAKEMEAETKKLIEQDMMNQVSKVVQIGKSPTPDEIVADLKEVARQANAGQIEKPTSMASKEDDGAI